MAERKNTKKFRLPVNTGINPDGFAEDVPLMDTKNYVLLPNGQSLVVREGYEIRRKDIIGVNTNRKSIYFISDPPDIDGGDLIVVINNKNGDLRIEMTEVVKAAGSGSSRTYSPSTFTTRPIGNPDTDLYWLKNGNPTGAIRFNRRGDITGYASFRLTTSDGTAVDGVDYTGFDYVVVWPPNVNSGYVLFDIDTVGSIVGKTVNFHLTEFSLGSGPEFGHPVDQANPSGVFGDGGSEIPASYTDLTPA